MYVKLHLFFLSYVFWGRPYSNNKNRKTLGIYSFIKLLKLDLSDNVKMIKMSGEMKALLVSGDIKGEMMRSVIPDLPVGTSFENLFSLKIVHLLNNSLS